MGTMSSDEIAKTRLKYRGRKIASMHKDDKGQIHVKLVNKKGMK
jgi:hypothetical protein